VSCADFFKKETLLQKKLKTKESNLLAQARFQIPKYLAATVSNSSKSFPNLPEGSIWTLEFWHLEFPTRPLQPETLNFAP
jgi:hypothetical protein